MAMFSHLCMNCMNPLPEGVADGAACPTCNATVGEPNPPQFLQTGTVLSERYMVGYLQQAGGDAAVYAGYDTVLKSPIVIREFWPQTLCERNEDDSLRVVAGCEQPYKDYLAKFLAHARVVARMRDLPASIPIYDIFQQNNTAYTVSERCEGVTLAAYLEARGGRLSWDEARPLFIPMMASLISLHKAGVRHFGLTPEVLVLGEDGKLHIGDFAIPEARTSDSELSADLRSGYAAPEQYSFGATCTEAVDVYGLAAVIFRTLVGNPPPDGQTRPKTNSDLTVPADVAGELPPHVAAALFSALQPSVEKRMASIAELRDRLAEAPAVAALLDDEADTAPADEEDDEEYEEEPRSHRTLYAVLIALGVIAALVVLAVLLLKTMFPGRFGGGGNEPVEPDTIPSGSIVIQDTPSTHPANMKVPVPYLLGQKYTDLRGKYVEDRMVLLGGLQYSENIAPGIVISQNPKADEEVDITQPVYVVISAGPEYVTIPDLTGWPLDHAIAYMQALGFEVQIDDVSTSSQEAGHIDSTSPARGNSLARGAIVRLRVSTATTTEETTTTTEATTTTTTTTAATTTNPPTSRPTTPPTSRPTTTEPEAPTTRPTSEPTTEATGEPTEEEQTTTGGEGDTTTTALPADV